MPHINEDFVEVIDKTTKRKARVPANYLDLFDHLERRERAPKSSVAPTKASKADTKKEGA